MSSATYYAWKAKFGGLAVSDAKRLLADTMLYNARVERPAVRKVATPAAKRQAVAHLQATLGMSERRACTVVGADRTSMRYRKIHRKEKAGQLFEGLIDQHIGGLLGLLRQEHS